LDAKISLKDLAITIVTFNIVIIDNILLVKIIVQFLETAFYI